MVQLTDFVGCCYFSFRLIIFFVHFPLNLYSYSMLHWKSRTSKKIIIIVWKEREKKIWKKTKNLKRWDIFVIFLSLVGLYINTSELTTVTTAGQVEITAVSRWSSSRSASSLWGCEVVRWRNFCIANATRSVVLLVLRLFYVLLINISHDLHYLHLFFVSVLLFISK